MKKREKCRRMDRGGGGERRGGEEGGEEGRGEEGRGGGEGRRVLGVEGVWEEWIDYGWTDGQKERWV